ncbi:MAG: hypothetical protein NT175_03965 [Bacteroidetes bacterium]|nr:hypothetical protein [Bacteroidota bacterium]
MRFKSIWMSFLPVIMVCMICAGQQKTQYTRWSLADIIYDFEGLPVYDKLITGGPQVESLDSKGGELLLYLTPKSSYDCRQTFRIGWRFDQDVTDLAEGQTINVEVFSYPVIDTVRGLLDCYRDAREVQSDNDWLHVRFTVGDSTGIASKPDLSFYWEKTSYLFSLSKTVDAALVYTGNGVPAASASGSFMVKDGIDDAGTDNAPFGTFTFEVNKKGVYCFRVAYLFNGMESDISPPGIERLLMDKLVVDHTMAEGSKNPVMSISLIGLLEDAVGRELKIAVRFMDSYRKPLPCLHGDTIHCEPNGNSVSYSPVISVPVRQYYLQDLKIEMPYSALNISTSQTRHLVSVYAEVFLDGNSIGTSKSAQTTFFW